MNKKICEMVAERVLAELNKGVVPWKQPWFGSREFVKHHNGKRYSLLNCILLETPGEYASFTQIQKEGGKVKKGAKSKIVVFWQMVRKEEIDDAGKMSLKTYPVLKYYRVFNLNDCEGIKKKYLTDDDKLIEHETVHEAETVIENYQAANSGLTIVRDEMSAEAFYSPKKDMIQVPKIEQYEKVEEFYSTLFHEMTHSTGHWSRLGRFKEDGKVAFGNEDYGKEELIAELGAAALCNKCGIESSGSFENSAAYLDGWTKAIKGNPELIVAAAGKADKAVEFILGGEE